jgi:hypothetical protein
MQNFGKNLKNWNINQALWYINLTINQLILILIINSIIFYCSYLIALRFNKLIGRCCSKKDALFITNLFNTFIDNLNMDNEKKEKIKKDIKNNWMCEVMLPL